MPVTDSCLNQDRGAQAAPSVQLACRWTGEFDRARMEAALRALANQTGLLAIDDSSGACLRDLPATAPVPAVALDMARAALAGSAALIHPFLIRYSARGRWVGFTATGILFDEHTVLALWSQVLHLYNGCQIDRKRAPSGVSFPIVDRMTTHGMDIPQPAGLWYVRAQDGHPPVAKRILESDANVFGGVSGALDKMALDDIAFAAWLLALQRHSRAGALTIRETVDLRDDENALGPFTADVLVSAPSCAASLSLRRWTTLAAEARRVARPHAVPRAEIAFQATAGFRVTSPVKLPSIPDATLQVSVWASDIGPATPIDLVIHRGAQPSAQVEWDDQVLDESDARRLALHWQEILDGFADLDRTVISVPALSSADRLTIQAWAGKPRQHPDACVSEFFEQQASRAPHRSALRSGAIEVSYGALNAKANRLAHYLRLQGVESNAVLAICLDRGIDAIVSMLAVLKTGSAYIPLSPSDPPARLAAMLELAKPQLILTTSVCASNLPQTLIGLVELDTAAENIALEAATDLTQHVGPEALAYIMYTSGSTGEPKGVAITHHGIARLTQQATWASLSEDEVFLHAAPLGFDASTLEIWAPLLNGGILDILEQNTLSVDSIASAIVGHGVTTVWLTAGLFTQVAAHKPECFRGLRQLIAGGDVLPARLVRDVARRYPDCRLINGYGPTECTTFATCYTVRDPDGFASTVPIGRPIDGTSIFLLDSALEPVPVGVPGEICVGGFGLARGYCEDPAHTAEKFVPDPCSGESGARLYRTGDLGRYLPTGDIEFLGRIDAQVKIRGYRVEPADVERTIESIPGVKQCAVVAKTGESGQKHLVAWVVLHEGARADASSLRAMLSDRVPDYLVPNRIVVTPAIPLNANGKLDRKAIEALTVEETAPSSAAQPSTRTEELLVDIWRDVLELDTVAVDQSFFDLGGDSMRAIQMIAAAEKHGLDVAPALIFQYQTIRELAAELPTSAGAPPSKPKAEPFALLGEADRGRVPADAEDAYPLTMLQGGMVYHSELNPGSPVYHDLTSYEMRGDWNESAVYSALAQVARRHAVLRTSFDLSTFAAPVQTVHRYVEPTLIVHDLRGMPADVRKRAFEQWMNAEKTAGFVWSKPPLWSVHVHLLEERAFRFTVSFHHSILDGWSVSVLLAELAELYASALAGREESAAKPLECAFRDSVELELAALRSEESREFWMRQLRDAPRLTLPRVARDPSRQGNQTAVPIPLARVLSDELKRAAQSIGVPIKTLLIAAHVKALAYLSGSSEVLTGVIAHNRPQASDADRILGLFLNALPLRLQVDPGSWRELARAVFEWEKAALPHSSYPMADIQRRVGGPPIFETSLTYTHFHRYRDAAPGDTLEVVSSRDFAIAHMPFAALFGQNPISSDIELALTFDAADFPDDQQRLSASVYETILHRIARDVDERHELAPLPVSIRTPVRRSGAIWRLDQEGQFAHGLFERQARMRPSETALISGGERMSFAELDAAANRLARHLLQLGIGTESRVGICLEWSFDTFVAAFAVWKAGAAYVPLDATLPPDRLAYMLEDSGVAAILTTEAIADTLPSTWAALVLMDADSDLWSGEDAMPPQLSLAAENLAYVLYTSGSTGRPKGVQVTHGGITTVVEGVRTENAFTASTRAFQFVSFFWDPSVLQMLIVLGAGGSLVLHKAPSRLTSQELILECERAGVNTLVLPPAVLHPLCNDIEEGKAAIPPGIRLLMTGGESPNPSRIRTFTSNAPEAQYVNAYGPTETSVSVTSFTPPAGTQWLDGLNEIPIGTPLPGVTVHLLDALLRPVPDAAPGDIYVGGAGVARGYINRPDLTAEVFIPDPFADQAGARMYRTGDRGRRLFTGDIEFLGRADEQVKIRGVRIEPKEIESILREKAAVSECFIEASANAGDKRLIAYVVPKTGAEFEVDAVRFALRTSLPDAMIPAEFILLDALPRTASGKIDRQLLKAFSPAATQRDRIAPRNPTEEIVARLWERVLDRRGVGVNENFFELGGHSLAATHVISLIRDAFQIDVPLTVLFDEPTIAGVASRLAQLQQSDVEPLDPIEPADPHSPLPASFGQERFMVLDQLSPGAASYNMLDSALFREAIDVASLKAAFSELRRRHHVLRSVFLVCDGQAVQQVLPVSAEGFEFLDISDLVDPERSATLDRIVWERAQEPFNLATGPLIRGTLIQTAPDEFHFILVVHHIISDGWSMRLIREEMAALYRTYQNGEPSPLPEPGLQYGDFSAWQRRQAECDRFDRQLDYWRRELNGCPPLVTFPPDRPRPVVQKHHGSSHAFTLSAEARESIAALARSEGVTPFMVIATALAITLGRYARTGDVTIGVPVAGRTLTAVRSVVGYFVNTVVLRSDLSGKPSLRELLRRIRRASLSAWANQDVPFERVVRQIQPERSPAQNPLFQVMLSYQQAERPAAGQEPTAPDTGAAQFDWSLSVVDNGSELVCGVQYDSDLYDHDTVAQISDHLASAVTTVATADVTSRVEQLDWLAAAEYRQIAEMGRGRNDSSLSVKCLHTWFENTARLWPDRAAVSCNGRELTYAELDRLAGRLAARLSEFGVRPDQVVGISLPRSVELIVAMLGVLKAGGAYLPLDPAHPADRRRWMIEDAGARWVVTDALQPDSAYAGLAVTPPVIGSDSEASFRLPTVHPSNLAYVLYTSGSTGRPKGVMVEHAQVARLFGVTASDMAFSPHDVWSMFHALGFDFSVWEIYGALLFGGKVVIVPSEVARSPRDFRELLERERVTVLSQTPGAFWQLVGDQPELPASVRLVVFGGEALHVDRMRRWMRSVTRPPRAVNMFGITETTVHVTALDVRAEDASAAHSGIGMQLPDLELYLVDESLRPVPVGAPGEICVGGAGVARGYRNNPSLTAERFVPNPFGSGRLYRSGDVGRYLKDGTLEYLGRIDQQVKIRGYRIELGEIEHTLAQHGDVRECAVVPRRYPSGDTRLVAYVSGREGTPDIAELRTFLEQRIPDYMTPAAFVTMPSLPLTGNAKLDRAALPEPEQQSSGRKVRGPRSMVEVTLAELWSEMLGASDIGLDDDFFYLGGHSLLAAAMVSRASTLFQADVPLIQFYQNPTLAALAALVEQQRLQQGSIVRSASSLIPIRPDGPHRPLFLINPLGYGTATYLRLAKRLGPLQPVYALQNLSTDADTLESLAAAYVQEIPQVAGDGDYILGGWSSGGVVAFEMARQLRASGAEVSRLLLFDTYTPLLTRVELDDGVLAGLLALETAHRSGRSLSLSFNEIRAQAPENRVAFVANALHSAGFTEKTIDETWLQTLIAGYRRRIGLLQQYQPAPYSGAITLFRCTESEDTFNEAVLNSETGIPAGDRTLGWATFSEQPIHIVDVPGWHVTMFSEPNVAVLAAEVAAILERMQGREASSHATSAGATAARGL